MNRTRESGIDRSRNQFVYRQIYSILRQELEEGDYDGMELLPSERCLCERFEVERNTVRKALELLVEEGLVEKDAEKLLELTEKLLSDMEQLLKMEESV